jgi:hypothetical protein
VQRHVGGSGFLFRELESDIRAGADAHESQQSGAEFRHGQIIINRRDEQNSQHNRPGKNLKTMKAVSAAVAENVA